MLVIGVWYNFDASGEAPPISPPTEGVDIDGDGIPDVQLSFSTYQALRVEYYNGDSWKYPSSRTVLTSQAITDLDTGKSVLSLQSYVYFTVESDEEISKVVYKASASVKIYEDDKNVVFKSLGDMNLDKTVTNIEQGIDIFVVSASMDSSDFQHAILPETQTLYADLYYNVKLSDISATITFADGKTARVGLTGMQSTTNQLWWKFKLTQTSSNSWQITDLGIAEWSWE